MTGRDAEQHYRGTTIGLALLETMDELERSGRIEPQLKEKVMQHFDRHMVGELRQARLHRKRMSFKARCQTYRFYDDRWFFVLRDVRFKTATGRCFKSDRLTVESIWTDLVEDRRKMREPEARPAKKKKKTAAAAEEGWN